MSKSNFPKMPNMKMYSDKNLNKELKLKLDSDKAFDPKMMTKPSEPGSDLTPEEKKKRFRRLAGILGGLHKK